MLYHGWTNRETWAAHLHITSDVSIMHHCAGATAIEIERFISELRDAVQSGTPGVKFGTGYDPIAMLFEIGSLWRVNWDEIADALKEPDCDSITYDQEPEINPER